MKTQITTNLILAAALSALAFAPLSAATNKSVPIAYPVLTVNGPENHQVARGDTRVTVTAAMGAPDRRVTSDVWIYRGYHADNSTKANADGCNAIVITFTGNRVSEMKFVNSRAAWLIAANPSRNVPQRLMAVTE